MSKDQFEQFEKPPEKDEKAEDNAFSALDLLMERPRAGDKRPGTSEFAANLRDPDSIEKAQEDFDKKFQKAMAAESPEALDKLYKENTKQLEVARAYIQSIQQQLEKKAQLV
jgi:hypothetical protein